MSKLYMFTTSHCTKCPEVKEVLSKKDVEVEYIDAEETPELAMKYMVMSVPTIVDLDDDKTYWGQEQFLAFVNTLQGSVNNMWIILTIILAINSIWLLKLNKDLANRNEYLIRQVKTNSLTNGLVLEPMSDEQIEELKKTWQDEMDKDTDNKEDQHVLKE